MHSCGPPVRVARRRRMACCGLAVPGGHRMASAALDRRLHRGGHDIRHAAGPPDATGDPGRLPARGGKPGRGEARVPRGDGVGLRPGGIRPVPGPSSPRRRAGCGSRAPGCGQRAEGGRTGRGLCAAGKSWRGPAGGPGSRLRHQVPLLLFPSRRPAHSSSTA